MSKELDHAPVRIAPPLVFAGHLLSAFVLHWLAPLHLGLDPYEVPAGLVLLLAGLLLGGFAVSRLMRAHTSPDPNQPTTALVTDGPYRFTRNPIYLGFFAIYLGFTLVFGTLWGVVLAPSLALAVTRAAIRPEEGYLERKFGEQYASYRSRVRQWI
jgi:protein-S-isoprenylcysteine O-methyltransferase Ste14